MGNVTRTRDLWENSNQGGEGDCGKIKERRRTRGRRRSRRRRRRRRRVISPSGVIIRTAGRTLGNKRDLSRTIRTS